MTNSAVRVEGLGKQYDLGRSRRNRNLREALTEGARDFFARAPRGRPGSQASENDLLWALRDVSFSIAPGETVGLVGANGSGKSTLLKILSRIVAPTTGTACVRGRVGALLEVGTGFHHELSGRDNIFLNGAILGMTHAEIQKRFDAIVDFAGVERFLDLPIKRYSSGMTLRLAFAVAAHLEPDVLIVDEVLAVGDAEFQKKCMARMDAIAGSGCTVLFVSHNLQVLQRLCRRALRFEAGRVVGDGPANDIIAGYIAASTSDTASGTWIPIPERATRMSGHAGFTRVRYGGRHCLAPPRSEEALTVEVAVSSRSPLRGASIAIDIYDQLGTKLINADTRNMGYPVDLPSGESVWRITVERLMLRPGRFMAGLWLAGADDKELDWRPGLLTLDVLPSEGGSVGGENPFYAGLVPCHFSVGQVSDLVTP